MSLNSSGATHLLHCPPHSCGAQWIVHNIPYYVQIVLVLGQGTILHLWTLLEHDLPSQLKNNIPDTTPAATLTLLQEHWTSDMSET